MKSRQPYRLMLRQLALLIIATVAPLLLLSCATTVKEEVFYTLIPDAGDPNEPLEGGATVNNLFANNPQTLTKAQWIAQMAAMNKDGLAVVCMSSQAEADFKGEIELLCSKTPCNQATIEAKRDMLLAMDKIELEFKKALSIGLR